MTRKTVEFSVCTNPGQDTHYLAERLQHAPYRVKLTTFLWEESWKVFTDYALHRRGADVSQVGAPLIGDLVAMNALRPFSSEELERIGGEAAFEPVAWQSSSRVVHGQVWAIPWTADPRVLFYWRDALETSSIDEAAAFQDLAQMEATLEQLQASGFATPWALPNALPLANLHASASWVWGAGGDFARQDGKRTLFCSPAAMEGWMRYFSLYRFMPRYNQPFNSQQVIELFTSRQIAVTMGSMYLGAQIRKRIPASALPNLGFALPPGPSLVGGSSLVLWAFSPRPREAFSLIEFLLQPEVMAEHCQQTEYLPTRLDLLSRPPFSSEERFRVCVKALQSGRHFPVIQAGGLLENSLAAALTNIWQEVLHNDGQNIAACLQKYLVPLGRRLDITLSQF